MERRHSEAMMEYLKSKAAYAADAAKAPEQHHPSVADLTFAALHGLAGLDEADQQHLQSSRCEHCEEWLHKTWTRSHPPGYVLARLQGGQYPETGVFGAALREHIASCERCQEISSEGSDIIIDMPADATAECLGLAELALAALNGPWSQREPHKQHLLETRCPCCERRLLEVWGRRPTPRHIVDSVDEFPETGAYGAALRQFLAELEQ
jgi:hypothetical protein